MTTAYDPRRDWTREDRHLPIEKVRQIAAKRANQLLNIHAEGNLFDTDASYNPHTDQWEKAS